MSVPAADAPAMPQMIIGGASVGAADGSAFDVVEPHAGTTTARAPRGGAVDVDRAVAAATTAFDGPWSALAASERGMLLLRLANAVRDHLEEIAQLESRNVGKPISGGRWEITRVADVIEDDAGATTKIGGETLPVTRPGFDFTLREPIGAVGLIVPWNFPLMLASWKLGPALAAGNTVVLKPASWSPLSALRFGELALEAGSPPGVVNVVTGPGTTAGAAIAAHPGIGKVALTGETGTGKEIMRLAAGNVKKVPLELRGKSPRKRSSARSWRSFPSIPRRRSFAWRTARPYGLSGSIWTRDIGRAIRVSRALRTGVISINCHNSVHVEAPFGGYKQSGIGRELRMHALAEYTQIKNVFVDLRT